MSFHYCPADEYLQYKFGPVDACDFPKRCAELCLKHKPVRQDKLNSQFIITKFLMLHMGK